ncbi:hypothetical protein G6F40_014580 [Rhizopus arrhizus]|nr:hypothetical protein G6F40_014580 [Rhizopus arrhizus]
MPRKPHPKPGNASRRSDYRGHATFDAKFKAANPAQVATYDNDVADLTAFMSWMAEPVQTLRVRIGVGVMLFLLLFFLVTWRLNASYWKHGCTPIPPGNRGQRLLDLGAGLSFFIKDFHHDGALFRNHVSVFATLPLRVVRKGYGFRDPRHRPVQQARRHLGDEPVRSSAHSGRARPGPERVAHQQRVQRRALPAPAAHAR